MTAPAHAKRSDMVGAAKSRSRARWGDASGPADTKSSPGRIAGDAELRRDLAVAVQRAELRLAYQPLVAAHSRRLVGVEALSRWGHPSFGQVSPARFIPLAEQAGLIRELTEWVVSEALDAQVRWRHAGLEVPVSVNLSAALSGDPGLGAWLLGALDERGLAPTCLTVEVTETAVMTDPAATVSALRPLHRAGVRISVDDFGTGYTSLAVLPDLPIDELKVDQGFVARMASSGSDEAIVRTVRLLAHRLGLDVVAEGVEDAATAQRLTEFGFDVLQGFYFAKPLSEEDFLKYAALDSDHGAEGWPTELSSEEEAARIAALRRYGILDADRDAVLDNVVELASQICDTPIALVSLVDTGRQWFAARVGLEVEETSRSDAFCAHTISGSTQMLEVPDARVDSRFASNPLVLGDPHVTFYAGTPLRTPDGHNLGSLCVIDQRPRTLTTRQRRALSGLAHTVMAQIEHRRVAAITAELPDTLDRISDSFRRGERDAAWDMVLRLARQLLLATTVGLLQREGPDSAWFTVTAVEAEHLDGEIAMGMRLETGPGVASGLNRAIETRQALFVADTSISPFADRTATPPLPARSILYQPLTRSADAVSTVISASWAEPVEQVGRAAAQTLALVTGLLAGTVPEIRALG
ncbi:MAG: EAL domain-containing protein [Acidimicrobiales bacterium]